MCCDRIAGKGTVIDRGEAECLGFYGDRKTGQIDNHRPDKNKERVKVIGASQVIY